jgi:hypothetical protein
MSTSKARRRSNARTRRPGGRRRDANRSQSARRLTGQAAARSCSTWRHMSAGATSRGYRTCRPCRAAAVTTGGIRRTVSLGCSLAPVGPALFAAPVVRIRPPGLPTRRTGGWRSTSSHRRSCRTTNDRTTHLRRRAVFTPAAGRWAWSRATAFSILSDGRDRWSGISFHQHRS